MDRRRLMMMAGIGALATAIPLPTARAFPHAPAGPVPPPAQPPDSVLGGVVFSDEFDGPPGAPPDYAKWNVMTWDEPGLLGHYRDDRRNVFLDGNSNLVIRATFEDGAFYSGRLQSRGLWEGGIGHTWEARIKLDCLTPGCWPAFWLLNWLPNDLPHGEVDIVEWFGNGEWPPNITVHARSDGRTLKTKLHIPVDNGWHTWRCQWDEAGFLFWIDYVDGAPPFFEVPAFSIDGWPFNQPGYTLFPILNLAVGGPGGGDPGAGIYPADMLVDWIRIW